MIKMIEELKLIAKLLLLSVCVFVIPSMMIVAAVRCYKMASRAESQCSEMRREITDLKQDLEVLKIRVNGF